MAKNSKKLPIWAKIVIIIFVILIVAFVIFVAFDLNKCISYWELYNEQEHFERVAKRVEKRYMQNEDSKFTSYEIYPLYDENDEISFFMVEFEPYGFVCVEINKSYSWLMSQFGIVGMYPKYDYYTYGTWYRYRIRTDYSEEYLEGHWRKDVYRENQYYEVADDGERIEYHDSYYKVANIQNEKRYLLYINERYIPAVKCGNNWLNLISMEEFDLNQPVEDMPSSNIYFVIKAMENL